MSSPISSAEGVSKGEQTMSNDDFRNTYQEITRQLDTNEITYTEATTRMRKLRIQIEIACRQEHRMNGGSTVNCDDTSALEEALRPDISAMAKRVEGVMDRTQTIPQKKSEENDKAETGFNYEAFFKQSLRASVAARKKKLQIMKALKGIDNADDACDESKNSPSQDDIAFHRNELDLLGRGVECMVDPSAPITRRDIDPRREFKSPLISSEDTPAMMELLQKLASNATRAETMKSLLAKAPREEVTKNPEAENLPSKKVAAVDPAGRGVDETNLADMMTRSHPVARKEFDAPDKGKYLSSEDTALVKQTLRDVLVDRRKELEGEKKSPVPKRLKLRLVPWEREGSSSKDELPSPHAEISRERLDDSIKASPSATAAEEVVVRDGNVKPHATNTRNADSEKKKCAGEKFEEIELNEKKKKKSRLDGETGAWEVVEGEDGEWDFCRE